ncbi:hypothetical protein [Nitratireductor sp. CH_MIT9313-5]|jgi:hypothetical protein|uniref:hypothetical protein n=2 Tax=Nitratireductor TaxID=245876 RepID=UPI00300876F3
MVALVDKVAFRHILQSLEVSDMAEKAVSKPAGRLAIGQSARSKDVITMFTVKRDMAKVLVDYKLPADAEVAIVSSKPSSANRIEKALGPRVARRAELVARALGSRKGTETAVDKSAFEPDARSRAILEGVRIAQEDLREAGGAYDLEQVRTLMRGVSRQAVDKRVHEGSLIAVPGPSNRRAFPTVQFKRDGTVVPGLKAVRDALRTKNSWMVLNFLVNPDVRLDGQRPIELLKAGDVSTVVEAAKRHGEQGA